MPVSQGSSTALVLLTALIALPAAGWDPPLTYPPPVASATAHDPFPEFETLQGNVEFWTNLQNGRIGLDNNTPYRRGRRDLLGEFGKRGNGRRRDTATGASKCRGGTHFTRKPAQGNLLGPADAFARKYGAKWIGLRRRSTSAGYQLRKPLAAPNIIGPGP